MERERMERESARDKGTGRREGGREALHERRANGEVPASNAKEKRKTPAELRLEQLKRRKVAESTKTSRATEDKVFHAGSQAARLFNATFVETPFASFHQNVNHTSNSPVDSIESSRTRMEGHGSWRATAPCFAKNKGQLEQRGEVSFKTIISSAAPLEAEPPVSCTELVVSKALAVTLPPPKDELFRLLTEASSSEAKDEEIIQDLTSSVKTLPIDWSLKTSAKFTSEQSFDWCQNVSPLEDCSGLQMFVRAEDTIEDCNGSLPQTLPLSQCSSQNTEIRSGSCEFRKSLLSWVHPGASLPSSTLLALTSAAGRGSQTDKEFLSRRSGAWVESFQSLYWMFRQGQCQAFYVCGQNSVAMFRRGGMEGAISASLSRSTRGLRVVLAEQDVTFSMPFCADKFVTPNTDDIRELKEFEKAHPGQASYADSTAAADNSPDSLLFMEGKTSVHGLYNVILNFRYLMGPTVGCDEPLLYSPAPFRNACLQTPEVAFRRMQRAESVPRSRGEGGEPRSSPFAVSYSLELKGALLPPWLIWRLCSVLQRHHTRDFSGSFLTEPSTESFNMLPTTSSSSSPSWYNNDSKERRETLGETAPGCDFPEAARQSLRMRNVLGRAAIGQLKCTDRSFLVSLTR